MSLKKIITEFKKYHYFIMNKGKIILLSSNNSNTTAKNNALNKLKGNVINDTIILFRAKLAKTSKKDNSLVNYNDISKLYFEISEYRITPENQNIKPTDNVKGNVFIKDEKHIKINSLKKFIKKYAFNKLENTLVKVSYI